MSGHLTHKDTRFLVSSGLALAGGAFGLARRVGPAWATLAAVPAAATLVLTELRRRERRGQADGQAMIEAVQALGSLQARLPLRRSLPPLTGWAASPQLAATLVDVVMERRPRVIVELGSGASTLVLGYALEAAGGGRLVSLDHDPAFAERTRADVVRHGLAGHVQVLDAPLVLYPAEGWCWYECAGVEAALGAERIDLLVVDGPPRSTAPLARYPAYPLLAGHLAPDAVVVADDARRSDTAETVRRWVREGGFEAEPVASPKGVCVLRRGRG